MSCFFRLNGVSGNALNLSATGGRRGGGRGDLAGLWRRDVWLQGVWSRWFGRLAGAALAVTSNWSRANNWPALSEITEAERGRGGGTCKLGAALSESTEADRGCGGGTWISHKAILATLSLFRAFVNQVCQTDSMPSVCLATVRPNIAHGPLPTSAGLKKDTKAKPWMPFWPRSMFHRHLGIRLRWPAQIP